MPKKKRKGTELIMRCATCGDMLARITRPQAVPLLPPPAVETDLIKGRYRLVTCRRRLIATIPVDVYDQYALGEHHSAPHDDFRFRSVERRSIGLRQPADDDGPRGALIVPLGEEKLRIWEFPYVCDTGDCYQKLLDDGRWRGYVGASPTDFVRLPEVH